MAAPFTNLDTYRKSWCEEIVSLSRVFCLGAITTRTRQPKSMNPNTRGLLFDCFRERNHVSDQATAFFHPSPPPAQLVRPHPRPQKFSKWADRSSGVNPFLPFPPRSPKSLFLRVPVYFLRLSLALVRMPVVLTLLMIASVGGALSRSVQACIRFWIDGSSSW